MPRRHVITLFTWYGWNRTPLTYEFTEELLRRAGDRDLARCGYRETRCPFPEIVELDNHPEKRCFVEARQ